MFLRSDHGLHCDAREKFLNSDHFNILVQKFNLPCFHQLVTGFHGNGNGISIPHFRFSAAPCQLRAVNAIWLTARIQNSSILKWQRERKRKCLPSHFTLLPLKRTLFYDCLSYWQTIIGHKGCPAVSLMTHQSKSLFHPSQSSVPHCDLARLWWSSWSSTCYPCGGYWSGKWSKFFKETIWWSQWLWPKGKNKADERERVCVSWKMSHFWKNGTQFTIRIFHFWDCLL